MICLLFINLTKCHICAVDITDLRVSDNAFNISSGALQWGFNPFTLHTFVRVSGKYNMLQWGYCFMF